MSCKQKKLEKNKKVQHQEKNYSTPHTYCSHGVILINDEGFLHPTIITADLSDCRTAVSPSFPIQKNMFLAFF